MSLRFRRTVKIAPGVRLNLSKSGLGVSVGVRGGRVGVGPRGVYSSVGLPGTGLHYRKQLSTTSRPGRSTSGRSTPPIDPDSFSISVDERGTVELTNSAGTPLPPRIVRRIRDQWDPEIRGWLEDECERWNQGIDEILNLHLSTPAPDQGPVFVAAPFNEPAPTPPALRSPGLLGGVLRSVRERAERENAELEREFAAGLAAWEERKAEHEAAEALRREEFEVGRLEDHEVMESFLEGAVSQIEWPRETLVSFQIEEDQATVYLDVDLPEIEDLPTEMATVASRGLRISVKEKSATQIRRDYAHHIHAILFRLIGEVFATLPSIELVVASGYSQRPDRATGQIVDEYLVSARVGRGLWEEIDFSNLAAVDLPLAFERFELRRKMTKTGIFRAVEPFGVVEA